MSKNHFNMHVVRIFVRPLQYTETSFNQGNHKWTNSNKKSLTITIPALTIFLTNAMYK